MRTAAGIWAGHRDLLLQACAAYNAQDVEALLARCDLISRMDIICQRFLRAF